MTKAHPNNNKDNERSWESNKNIGMAKLQQIIVGASQKHVSSTLKGVRLDWNFLFLGKKGCQGTLKALDMMSKDIRGTKKL
jgi:hypothetical protein